MEARESASRLDGWTWLALTVVLIGRPLVYCALSWRPIIGPIITEHNRPHWCLFHLLLLVFQWIPFLFIWWALRRNRESWFSIGVDWGWFWRQRFKLAILVVVLGAGAFLAPRFHYGDTFPGISKTLWLLPVTTPERLFVMTLVAVSAGVCEEVQYRGFAFTRLGRIIRNPWLILPITMISFLFVHGTPRDTGMAVSYLMAGAAFGVAFILMKLRRLEVLILIHYLIDASMVFAP